FTRCIIEATFTRQWKQIKLIILKDKKDPKNPKSYRLISLLPTPCKTIEIPIIKDI
ncbi:Uncharacterized protein FWK35_00013110, partial [Aphis craccivora]